MLHLMALAILMPAYDEADALARTLDALRALSNQASGVTVFLVDDGSQLAIDPSRLPEPTSTFRLVLARHPINLGQGAALETARQLALGAPPFDAYVTMDADGQHGAADALRLARAIHEGADVAFGNRFLGDSNVPVLRGVLLRAARTFERILTGLAVSDAHNGLRAFSRRALEAIVIRQNRMAHATEIKQQVAGAPSLVVVEVPVSVRYTKETLKKGQGGAGAADIVRDLVAQYLFGESK
jgi:glycosyltransferase involved in cell wall biosynthesis